MLLFYLFIVQIYGDISSILALFVLTPNLAIADGMKRNTAIIIKMITGDTLNNNR